MEPSQDVAIRAELFTMQHRMLEELAKGADLQRVLATLCLEVERWWEPREVRSSVLLVEGDTMRHGAGPSLESEMMAMIDGEERGPRAGSCGTAAHTLEPVIVTDVMTDPRWSDYVELARMFDLEACWSFPIMNRRRDDAIATLAIYTQKEIEPTELELRFMAGLADVTGLVINRALIERALTEESVKLAHLVSGTKIGMWEWDAAGPHLSLDDRILQMLGYERAEYEAMTTEEQSALVHPKDSTQLDASIAAHSAGESDFFEADFRVQRRNGEWLWVRDRGRILDVDERGYPRRIIGTLQDINDEKAIEDRQLRMQRLESLGRLAGGIAHDFNNIMVGIFGSISLAREEIEEGHPAREDLEIAEESLERARNLTNQLLTFAKGGEPVKAALDLAELVESVARFDLSGSSVSLDIEVDDELWTVVADPGQIQQVFSNLVMNAREAMGDRGRLTVHIDNWEGEIEPGDGSGRYVRAKVSDSGSGIDPSALAEMFDPYFTTKDDGRGLGLATVHSIVTRHGGTIRFETRHNEGTTFEIFLPAAPEAPIEKAETGSSPNLDQVEGLSVLILDDQAAVRRTACRMLESMGHTPTSVSEGSEAIDVYAAALKTGSPYDLVIADLTIPGGMGGEEAAEAILELDPSARIIASSGYTDTAGMANYEENGFVGIIPKPYTLEELALATSRAYARKGGDGDGPTATE